MSVELGITKVITKTSIISHVEYPVGSYFLSNIPTDPYILLGFGTWELVRVTQTVD